MAPTANNDPSPHNSPSSASTPTRRSMQPHTTNQNIHPRIDTGTTLRGDSPSPSPRSASISLQAAATMNAGLQREPTIHSPNGSHSRSRRSSTAGRRRSLVLMNVHANDPSIPAPGEMIANGSSTERTASPQSMSHSLSHSPIHMRHRDRQPSLGELHQELESEQEAQVNRLLVMIREQQVQLQQLQAAQGHNSNNQSAIDDSNSVTGATNGVSFPGSAPPSAHPHTGTSLPRSPGYPRHLRSSFDIARADIHRRSRTPSRGASPRLGAVDSNDGILLSGRDESALYQAETQMLVRENQMLRHRIRELERQLSDLHTNSTITHEPATPSHLLSAHSFAPTAEEDVKMT